VTRRLRYFSDEQGLSPILKALNEVRQQATREGWCYQHVQAIIVSIDRYAEAATGNREYFLNKPRSMPRSALFAKLAPLALVIYVVCPALAL
jgi:hypothetical protein